MKKISIWQILSSVFVFIIGCASTFTCIGLIFFGNEFAFLRPFRLFACNLTPLLPKLFISDSTGWDYLAVTPISLIAVLISILLIVLSILYFKKKAIIAFGTTIIIISIDLMLSFAYIGEPGTFVLSIVVRCLIIFLSIMSIKHINENYEFY